jgi:hypothetical protein
MRTFYRIALIYTTMLAACGGGNRNHVTLDNSWDTTSVDKAGQPRIRDTATVSKDRKDSARMTEKSKPKGNADPSGRIKNQ